MFEHIFNPAKTPKKNLTREMLLFQLFETKVIFMPFSLFPTFLFLRLDNKMHYNFSPRNLFIGKLKGCCKIDICGNHFCNFQISPASETGSMDRQRKKKNTQTPQFFAV